jgi:uncharacterized protein
LLIRIDDIKEKGLFLDFEEAPETFPALVEMIDAGDCKFLAPISTHLRVMRINDMVEVEGRVDTVVRLNCSRCLKDFETSLAAEFALTYTRALPEAMDESGEEETEVTAEEMGLILFQGEEIDLKDAIQEQVIMAFPQRPLCREDCKGLCPQCGADLNEGDCGCNPPKFNKKFAALKNFKVEKK